MLKRILFSFIILLFSITTNAAVKDIKLKADFRYRHETISQPKSSTTAAKTSRHRIRARVKLSGEVNKKVEGAIRLSTGNQSIASTNQDLKDADNKAIELDQAYIKAKPVDNFNIFAGKMPNQYTDVGNTGVLFDGDYTPEGITLSYKRKDLKINPDIVFSHHRIGESNTTSDIVLWSGQLGAKAKMEKLFFTTGLSYHHMSSIQNSSAVATKSNSVTSGNFTYGYTVLHTYLEAGVKMNKLKASLYGHHFKNSDVSQRETGYLFGLKLKYGKFGLNHNYRWADKDAWIGALSDADAFGGDGTDGHGTKTTLSWKYMENSSLKVTFHSYNRHSTDRHLEKIHMDLGFKF